MQLDSALCHRTAFMSRFQCFIGTATREFTIRLQTRDHTMKTATLALACLAFCFNATLHAQWQIVEYENVLGTSLELQLDCGPESVSALEKVALAEIDRLSTILSNYDSESEVSLLLLTSRPGEPIEISASLVGVLQQAEKMRITTRGALDIRAGALGRLWHAAATSQIEPAASERNRVCRQLSQAPYTISGTTLVRHDSLAWSLDAIAKGTILDALARRLLEERPELSGLVNIGGDIRSFGRKTVMANIEDPFRSAVNQDSIASVQLPPGHALCTSGGYRRGFKIGNRQFSHIFDPRSGLPVTHVASASVMAKTAEQADALATATSVMPLDDALELINRTDDAECLVVLSSGEIATSDGWPNLPAGRFVSDDEEKTDATETDGRTSKASTGLIVDFTLVRPKGSRDRRPYVAVWLEDKDGFPVKTALLWMQTEQPGPRWHRDLTRWYRNNRMRKAVEKSKLIGTISGATRGAGEYQAAFDGTDNSGKKLPEGVYTLCLEVAREHGTYQLIREKVNLSGAAIKKTELKGNVEMGKVAYQFIPVTSSKVQ